MVARGILLLSILLAGCGSGAADPGTTSDEIVAPTFAGLYTEDLPLRDEGRVWQLSLRPDATFSMAVQGLYLCERLSCPTSSVLGRLGWTRATGTWKPKAGSAQVELSPEGVSPIVLDVVLGATSFEVSGTLDGHPIAGRLAIKALFNKAHPSAKQIDGTWVVESPVDGSGHQPDLSGAPIDVRRTKHFVHFDGATRTFREWRGVEPPLAEGPFALGADPEGKGVLVMESDPFPNAAQLDAVGTAHLDIRVAGGAVIRLAKQ